jgi:hypothetical protein
MTFLGRFAVPRSVFLRPTFASAARQARSPCLAASSEREGAGTRSVELQNGITTSGVISAKERGWK